MYTLVCLAVFFPGASVLLARVAFVQPLVFAAWSMSLDGSAMPTLESSMLQFLETVDFPSRDEEILKLTMAVFSENLLTVRCMSHLAGVIVALVLGCMSGP